MARKTQCFSKKLESNVLSNVSEKVDISRATKGQSEAQFSLVFSLQ